MAELGYLPEPYHLPGYGGHVPTIHYRFGKSFGIASREILEDPCVAHSPISVLEHPYSAKICNNNNNNFHNHCGPSNEYQQQLPSFNLHHHQQQQEPPPQRPKTSKGHNKSANLPGPEPEKPLNRPKTCCCHDYLQNLNNAEQLQQGPHFEFIFPATTVCPPSSSSSPAHYSVSCEYRPKTNSASQTGGKATDSKKNDGDRCPENYSVSAHRNVSKSTKCASKSSSSSVKKNDGRASKSASYCFKENFHRSTNRQQLVNDDQDIFDCPKRHSTRRASDDNKNKSDIVVNTPAGSCPGGENGRHKNDRPPSSSAWHPEVVGCSDLGCCCPPICCCPPPTKLEPKNKNFVCPDYRPPSSCCLLAIKKCDSRIMPTQTPKNQSPYAARACRTEQPNQDIYRHCESLASGYSGHVPGLTFYSHGRTYGKATYETKDFMDKCMMFNMSSKNNCEKMRSSII